MNDVFLSWCIKVICFAEVEINICYLFLFGLYQRYIFVSCTFYKELFVRVKDHPPRNLPRSASGNEEEIYGFAKAFLSVYYMTIYIYRYSVQMQKRPYIGNVYIYTYTWHNQSS